MGYYSRYSSWGPYVSVAERRQKAEKHIKALQKKGVTLNPVVIEGRAIANTFWGKAWCENLEAYSDYENRLPRGRTYVRNGSVIDLKIIPGCVNAQVMGSSLYHIKIAIKPMPEPKWKRLVKACTGKIDSLIELLKGQFSKGVMEIMIEKESGLFPSPKEISMSCSCPDYAGMCKHIAAVLYSIGSSLDSQPEQLFILRHVNHTDLIAQATALPLTAAAAANTLADTDLSTVFGIELEIPQKPLPKNTLKPQKKSKKKKRSTRSLSSTKH